MESSFVVYLREQAFALEKIANASGDTKTVEKIRTVCVELLEKALFYEELVAIKRRK
jgi:hypothetical protein